MEDLNFLLHRQRMEQSSAEKAQCEVSRRAHEQLAKAYGERIRLHLATSAT